VSKDIKTTNHHYIVLEKQQLLSLHMGKSKEEWRHKEGIRSCLMDGFHLLHVFLVGFPPSYGG
jgi:hypothetical protein